MSDDKVVWSAERKSIRAVVWQESSGYSYEVRGGLGDVYRSNPLATKDDAVDAAKQMLEHRDADWQERAERIDADWRDGPGY